MISIIRAIFYWRYRADDLKFEHTLYWQRISVGGALCAGLLWGAGAMWVMGADPAGQWLWSFAIGGMCAGSASLHSAHLPTALSFTLPACIPLTVALLLLGTPEGTVAALMSLAFIVVTTFTAILFSKEFGRTLSFKFALEQRAVELGRINQRLSKEMDDHRSTSEALYQAQKMEALGSLTGGCAHDFNNRLTVILGNLDMISRRADRDDLIELATSAIGAAESGANLTSRLLAFARKQTLSPKLVDLHQVIGDFEALLLHAVHGPVKVEFAFATPHAAAFIDVAHFQAALLNLVVNARDAIPRAGRIVVSTSRVSLGPEDLGDGEAQPGEFIAISVTDDGDGMSPETLIKAFEPFYTTKAGKGSGLGLSQVYGFARQSGGFGRIESEEGKGTCVTVFIPASDEPLPVAAGMLAERVAGAERASPILIVDDNPAVLRMLKAGLVAEGWETVATSSGRAAIDLIESGRPIGIVVTDIDMPGEIDGLHLEREVSVRWPHIPVLLISGAPIPIAEMRPDLPFLIKPFTVRVLLDKIRNILRRTDGAETKTP